MSQRLLALRPRRVLHALQRAGFFIHHTTGGHYVLKHPDKPALRVTIPYHNKGLKRRPLESIIEQAEMTFAEFLGFL
jgi:predicted RNA binding protein YcfA (HicA-like mRNA interferase family)